MKILVLVSRALLGGHVISAFTVARYLRKRGHTIIFAGGRGKLTSRIEAEFPFIEVPIPFYHGQRECYFTWKSFDVISPLRHIIKKHDVDIVHAFDARSYIHGTIASLLEKKPITCTLCGGIDPYYNIPITGKIIVFSEEQKQKMVRRFHWQESRMEVIRTRVDVETILRDTSPPPIELPMKENIPVLMLISSFDSTKADSILQVMDALEILVDQGVEFQMVFIGGRGAFFENMKARGAATNRKVGREVFTFTGPVVDAFKLLRDATVVMGVGRSAFEGMALGKPTVIVGANGFAGVVSEDTVADIGYYNFSGRNQKEISPPEQLAQVLVDMLSDPERRERTGQFGQDFVMKEIDVKAGLKRIEHVYQCNIEEYSAMLWLRQWLSLGKIMIPIWRDNFWHTIGVPIKRMIGKKAVLDEILDE